MDVAAIIELVLAFFLAILLVTTFILCILLMIIGDNTPLDTLIHRISHDPETEALIKSKKLLFQFLTPKQKEEFKSGYILCNGNISGVTYAIFLSASPRNVLSLSSKKWYCSYSKQTFPMYDLVLTKKLLIENDEKEFLGSANGSY